MRLTVASDGSVIVDTSDPAEAAAFVRQLRDSKPPKRRRKAAPKPLEIESEDIPLSSALVDTWNWLVANDSPEGAHAKRVAEALGVKEATAIYRLGKLTEKELAHKTSPGHYRAGG
jgi:hypothetical protein